MDLKIIGFETRVSATGKPVDYVHLTNRGNINETGQISSSTWHRVEKLRPPADMAEGARASHMRWVWSVVAPAYEAWRKDHEIPETGTPLGAWAGITAAQAEVLRQFGMRTVEDVASMPEALIGKLALPNARGIRSQAKQFLDGRPAEEQSRKIEELEAQLQAALEMLSERAAESDADDAPKRRGRPPKAKTEAEAA